jgi:hypothetical protein
MTLPYERYAAVVNTEEFLKDLINPKKTPQLPKTIRQQAYHCLYHYPSKYLMDVVATNTPSVFETQNPIDDVSMLIHTYEASK